jgi:hypothetical protein
LAGINSFARAIEQSTRRCVVLVETKMSTILKRIAFLYVAVGAASYAYPWLVWFHAVPDYDGALHAVAPSVFP